jgi:hypothetical protein
MAAKNLQIVLENVIKPWLHEADIVIVSNWEKCRCRDLDYCGRIGVAILAAPLWAIHTHSQTINRGSDGIRRY